MTYTFISPSEGRYFIYDTSSGAVIPSNEIESYICDALDPCGEHLCLPEKCPSEIRYELARFASTDVSQAYERIKRLADGGYIFGCSEKCILKVTGEYSANDTLLTEILTKNGLSRNEISFI